MKRITSLLLCLVLAFGLLTGCGGSSKDAMELAPMETYAPGSAADMDYGYSEEKGEMVSDSLTSSTGYELPDITDRKLVKTVWIDAETEHFDDLNATLNARIGELGGYIESRESNSGRRRYCSMIIRIPAENLAGFVDQVNTSANVTSSSESAKDVTLDYVDTEAKITALETEQARLLELLAEAENLTAILTIEERLSEVTYQLERHATRLRELSNLVDYATVHLSIREVEVLTPVEEPTVWQRISTGFNGTVTDLGENLTDLFVWVIVESPYILIFGVLIGLTFFAFRKAWAYHAPERRKSAPPEEKSE